MILYLCDTCQMTADDDPVQSEFYSTSPCDGCGQSLHGIRYEWTLTPG